MASVNPVPTLPAMAAYPALLLSFAVPAGPGYLGNLEVAGSLVLGGGLGLPKLDEIANKPDGQIEIDRGENVMLGTTRHRLGRVEDVLFDHGELIGVVIRPDGFFKRDVVLPTRFINRADDMALFADLTESDIEQLKPFVDAE